MFTAPATEWTEQDSRNLTIALVAIDGHPMALRGPARHDAVRAMLAHGVPVDQMAHRLCISVKALRRDALRAGIQLPDTHPVLDWWVVYTEPSRAIDHKRRKRQQRREMTKTIGTAR